MSMTARKKAARRWQDSAGLRIEVDGQAWTFRPEEVTARQVSECRRVTGMSVRALFAEAASADPDLDVFAGLLWLAKRQAGETVTFEEVLDTLSYDSDLDVQPSQPDSGSEDDDLGKTRAGS